MGAIIWLASYPKSGNTWMRVYLRTLELNPNELAGINTIKHICLGDDCAVDYARYAPRLA